MLHFNNVHEILFKIIFKNNNFQDNNLFRYYELIVSRAESGQGCAKLSTVKEMNITFVANENKLEINVVKGEEHLKVQHNDLELSLTGNYSFSVRAVVEVYNKATSVKSFLFGKADTVCVGKLTFKLL